LKVAAGLAPTSTRELGEALLTFQFVYYSVRRLRLYNENYCGTRKAKVNDAVLHGISQKFILFSLAFFPSSIHDHIFEQRKLVTFGYGQLFRILD
jgi:hypothetical protein